MEITVKNNNIMPVNDEQEHVPYEWCECHPMERWTPTGLMWLHRPYDMRHLIAQADAIRKITSMELWDEAEANKPPLVLGIVPFEENDEEIVWPMAAHKD